jgi:nucleotide-binding universal stress UspA family protein
MKAIRKILVPTDFSDNAPLAYQHAQEIANRFGATIDLIHVIPTLKYFHESMAQLEAPLNIVNEELYPGAQKEAKKRLQQAMDEYLADESKGKAIVNIDRKPSTTIVEVAKAKGYDLIVMPSKGRHNSNLLRGSTTSKVIRHSVVPVFTVDAGLTAKELKQILLPTDGSMISFSALPYALSLADIYGAEISLFHVEELYGTPLNYESKNPNKTGKANVYEALIDHLEDYLISANLEDVQIARGEVDFEDQFIITEGASSRRINFNTVIQKGISAHLGIEEYASDNVDVVVMATHGHSGLTHFFLGSTTEKVAQMLNKPVLTVNQDSSKLNKE